MCRSYENQKEVGAGIKRAYKDVPGLKREDIFIVSCTNVALSPNRRDLSLTH